jgi:hypothetical protein
MKTQKGRIIQYCVCLNFTADRLSELVTEKLKCGWELHGKIKYMDGKFTQVVVLRDVAK